jgi:Fe-S-cluster containining protein
VVEAHDPDVDALERRLLAVLDSGFAHSRGRAGEHLLCARGCHDCCFGPFPITRLDVLRLRRGLRHAAPEVAESIVADAREAVVALRSGLPGVADSGKVVNDEGALDGYLERLAGLACPVLDRTSGACRLWDHRPVACRTYGPPLSFEGEPAPHCGLCFVEATPETVEACRWDPDPDGLERQALRLLGVDAVEDWETLVAYAVAGGDAE